MLTYVHMAENQQKVWDEPTKMQYAHNNNGEKKMHFSCVKIAATTNAKKRAAHTHTHTIKKNQPFCWRCHKLKQNVRKIATPTEKRQQKSAWQMGFGDPRFFAAFFFGCKWMLSTCVCSTRQEQQRRQQMHACCTTNAAATAAAATSTSDGDCDVDCGSDGCCIGKLQLKCSQKVNDTNEKIQTTLKWHFSFIFRARHPFCVLVGESPRPFFFGCAQLCKFFSPFLFSFIFFFFGKLFCICKMSKNAKNCRH